MQTLLLVAVAVAIVAVVGVLVARDRPLLAEDPAGPPPLAWPPTGPIDTAALVDVRFPVALRGYRMDQVDRVLDDAAAALAERDARIDQLVRVVAALGAPEAQASGVPGVVPDQGAPVVPDQVPDQVPDATPTAAGDTP